MIILKIRNCFDCSLYSPENQSDEGAFGLCNHEDRWDLYLDKFPEYGVVPEELDNIHEKLVKTFSHYPEDIPQWCPYFKDMEHKRVIYQEDLEDILKRYMSHMRESMWASDFKNVRDEVASIKSYKSVLKVLNSLPGLEV